MYNTSKLYESDRLDVNITQADISVDANFADIDKSEDMVNHLLANSQYNIAFKQTKSKIIIVNIQLFNKAFYECICLFSTNIIDSVIIFDVFTNHYNLDPTHAFEKLVSNIRTRLTRDLAARLETKIPNSRFRTTNKV